MGGPFLKTVPLIDDLEADVQERRQQAFRRSILYICIYEDLRVLLYLGVFVLVPLCV